MLKSVLILLMHGANMEKKTIACIYFIELPRLKSYPDVEFRIRPYMQPVVTSFL
jgi:hypothetical protein